MPSSCDRFCEVLLSIFKSGMVPIWWLAQGSWKAVLLWTASDGFHLVPWARGLIGSNRKSVGWHLPRLIGTHLQIIIYTEKRLLALWWIVPYIRHSNSFVFPTVLLLFISLLFLIPSSFFLPLFILSHLFLSSISSFHLQHFSSLFLVPLFSILFLLSPPF